MITLFLICAGLVFWAYFGYPLSMYILAKVWPNFHSAQVRHESTISVIIAAAGAGAKIYNKLADVFDTDYPWTKMEVIVVMDGYCKETEDAVLKFMEDDTENLFSIRLSYIEKGGKEAAQLCGVNLAQHEICIFTDVDTTFDTKTFFKLVNHFADAKIGAVDGMSRVVTNGHSNEGIYLKYENKIREWESRSSGLVTLGGCLFAARRWVLLENVKINNKPYPGFVSNMQSDFRTALVMRTRGLLSILERGAVANFADGNESKEFNRKHRTIVRGINTALHNLHLLNPFKYGLFSYAFFCHKFLKWSVPFFMIGAYISSSILTLVYGSWFWLFMSTIQTLVYFFPLSNYSESENKYLKILKFLVVSNAAILKAWYSYIVKGERFVFWEPTKR